MKISLKVHPNSSKKEIKKINEISYEIWLKEKPVDNKANIALEKILKKYFGKPVLIKSGLNSKKKTAEISD